MSLSLYRKYRSQTFDELVGQEPVVKTLQNAISTGRIGHAYLFTGPRGVGKTSAARLLARAANCLSPGPNKPCNECANCLAANRDIATDLIEIDAASNTGVDNIRELIERAQFSPAVWTTKFYIIDEVHMLSVSAFNALLKTLEEPPPHVAFILATTEIHKVPATVASRCQRFDFRRVPLKAMVDRIQWVCDQEGIEIEPAAVELVARQSTGSMRDALSLMDQLRVFSEGTIKLSEVQDMLGASGSERVADFVDCLVAADLASGLRLVNAILDEGLDIRQFNRQTVEHLRQLMLIKSGAANSGEGSLLDVTSEMKQRMEKQANQVALPDLLRWTKVFAAADGELRSTAYRQLPMEMALVEAVLPPVAAPQPAEADSYAAAERSRPPQPTPFPQPAQRTQPQPPTHASQRATPPSAPVEPQISTMPPPIQTDLGGFANGSTAPMPSRIAETSVPAAINAEATQPAALDAPPSDIPAVEDDGDEFHKLQQLWPYLIDQINARSKQMAAVFRNPEQVHPYSISGKTVTISFRDPFHAKRARDDQQRALLEQVLSRALGHPCLLDAITFDQEGKEPAEGASQGGPGGKLSSIKPKEKLPSPSETTRGRAAMNTFGIDKFEMTDE